MSSDEWVRALGVDYGSVRIGLAVSDDIGLLAHPLETVDGRDVDRAVGRIGEVARDRGIRDLVLGLPLRSDGEAGSAVKRVREFADRLRKELPADTVIHEVDESYTTQVAMEKLHAAGRNEKNARPIIDQAAAVEILQRWLDCRSEGG